MKTRRNNRRIRQRGGLTFKEFRNMFRWPWRREKRVEEEDEIQDAPVYKAELLPLPPDYIDTPFEDARVSAPNTVALSTEMIQKGALQHARKENHEYLKWSQEYYDPKLRPIHMNVDIQEREKRELAMRRTYNQTKTREKILDLKIKGFELFKNLQEEQKLLYHLNKHAGYYPMPALENSV
jgi:hypothetical protein